MDIPKVGDVCISRLGNLYRIEEIEAKRVRAIWLGTLRKAGAFEPTDGKSSWWIGGNDLAMLAILDLV